MVVPIDQRVYLYCKFMYVIVMGYGVFVLIAPCIRRGRHLTTPRPKGLTICPPT